MALFRFISAPATDRAGGVGQLHLDRDLGEYDDWDDDDDDGDNDEMMMTRSELCLLGRRGWEPSTVGTSRQAAGTFSSM